MPLAPGRPGLWYLDPENDGVYLERRVRQREGAWTITLFLINAQTEPEKGNDGAWVFWHEQSAAVADGRALLISSANLTEFAMTLNMEMGLLLWGGEWPSRVEQHFDHLIRQSILQPLAR